MTELWFIPIISILGLISTIISSKGSLFDKRFTWYKRLTHRGQLVCLIGLMIIVLSIWQYLTVKKKNDQKDIIQNQERKSSDSIISLEIKKGVDSNRRQLFTDLSQALSKQYLKIDTVTKSIERLRDSAKTIIINSPRDKPIIIIRDGGISHIIRNDSLEVKLNLLSTQGPSKIFFINCFVEVTYKDGSKGGGREAKKLVDKIIIPKDNALMVAFTMFDNQEFLRKIKFLNIALIGKYSQLEDNKEIILRDVYKYSLSERTVDFLPEDEKDLFLKRYNIQ